MKKIYFILLSMVCSTVISAQVKKQVKDTITKKHIRLSDLIITGNLKTDPTHIFVKNNLTKKIVQPKNVADLFSDINGFSVVKRGNYAIDPTFRASLYEQLNIMYDGATKAVHACPNRMDPITTHIIPEEISKIEVVKGPYTVRYGATFGGIVNLVTRDISEDDYGLHGKLSTGYETNGSSSVSMFRLQHAAKKYDIAANVGYRNFGDYEDGNNTTIPSAFKSADYGIKVGINLSDSQRLQAHWRQSFGRDVKHAALPMDTEFDNSSILSLNYKASNLGKSLKSITAKGYFSYVDHLMTNENRPNFKMVYASSPVESTTIGGKFETHWMFNENTNFYAGIDLNHIEREGNRTRTVKMKMGAMLPVPKVFVDKIWQDASISDVGIFGELKWNLPKQILITTGARLDFVSANATDPAADFAARYSITKQNETNASVTVSLKKRWSRALSLEVAYGRGIRTANMAERYINHFTVGQDGYEYLGNPFLKPEVNNQFEVGFKGAFVFENEQTKWSYQTSIYHSIFENYIVGKVDPTIQRKFMPTKVPTAVKVFTNLKDANKTGFEFATKLNFNKEYFIKTQLAYVHTENKDFKESLPLNPPFTAKFVAGLEKENYWVNASVNLVSKQTNIAKTFGETNTPGYETIDLKFGATPFANITVGMAVINLLNKTYRNHLNFSYKNQSNLGTMPITDPGRNFTAFIQYTF